ncbi:MAG: hypothetical protein LUI10_01920 [Lachnospiraceae bacterium]|nr:hypothetical protein [Lachnospiraceae bacterium]
MRRPIRYPESLLEALNLNKACHLKTGLDYSRLTVDQKKGLRFLLENFLTEREQMVMTDRYVHCMSIKKIAEKYSLTEIRIRGIITQSLRNLNNRWMLLYVVQGYEVRMKFMREYLAWMEQRYRYWIENTDGLHLFYQDIGILELPVRVIHALRRYDVNQVRDLVILSQYNDGIRGIRHLGDKAEEQIESALQKGGLLPKHYEKIKDKPYCINQDRELAAFQNLNIWFLREHEKKSVAPAESGDVDDNHLDEEKEKSEDGEQEGDEEDGNSGSQ